MERKSKGIDKNKIPATQRTQIGQTIALGQILGVSDVDEISKSSNQSLEQYLPSSYRTLLEKLKLEVEIAQLQGS